MSVALWTARVLAFLGFVDAAYLTASHFAGQAVACGPTGGCEVVLSSRFATVGEIPVAAIGLAYYGIVSLLVWTPRDSWSRGIALAFAGIEGVALVVSGALVWIQYDVIGSWCRFCLVSAAITVALFACALSLLRSTSSRTAVSSPT